MTTPTLLILGDMNDAPVEWLRLRDGAVAARGAGEPPRGEPGVAEEMVLAPPGEAVALHWIELPELTGPQAQAAARIAAADIVAEPLDRLHVAIGPRDAETGLACMSIVSEAQMLRWTERAYDRIVPLPLLVAPPPEGVRRMPVGTVELLRGPQLALAAEPELAALLAEGQTVETLDEATFEAELPALVAAPLLDLRQGRHAIRRRRLRIDWPLIRRLAALGLAILAVTLLLQLALILRYTLEADAAERGIAAVARRALPREGRIAEPEAQLGERLDALRGRGLGYQMTASSLFAAVRQSGTVSIAALAFDEQGNMRATVSAPTPAELAALESAMSSRGFAASLGAPSVANGRHMAELTVRPR